MITPRFKLTQSETTVTITIRAPYCNLQNLEVDVDEHVFLFFASPYYLRLHLPGQIVENESASSSFDTDSGEFTFTYEKTNPKEHFPDLDLITKLLCPKIEIPGKDANEEKIVVLTNEAEEHAGSTGVSDESPEEFHDQFGFAMRGKCNFKCFSSEFNDVLEVNPQDIGLSDRRKMRLQREQNKFSADHYIADYIENDEILEINAMASPWSSLKNDEIIFTDNELDFLKDLHNSEYNLNEEQVNYCHCCLIDILFAYCYDQRTTQFDGSLESGWTISKLAASLCWLDGFQKPKEALVSAFRRSLIFPLYRNFDLSQAVFCDLKQLLQLDEKFIIKCLIHIYNVFLEGDCFRYILNDLFVKDYIIYVMKWDKIKWRKVVSEVEQTEIKKSDLGLNLAELETDVYSEVCGLAKLDIKDGDSDDSDTESDSSTTDSDETYTDSSDKE